LTQFRQDILGLVATKMLVAKQFHFKVLIWKFERNSKRKAFHPCTNFTEALHIGWTEMSDQSMYMETGMERRRRVNERKKGRTIWNPLSMQPRDTLLNGHMVTSTTVGYWKWQLWRAMQPSGKMATTVGSRVGAREQNTKVVGCITVGSSHRV
jgi:hypothetical protein